MKDDCQIVINQSDLERLLDHNDGPLLKDLKELLLISREFGRTVACQIIVRQYPDEPWSDAESDISIVQAIADSSLLQTGG